MVSNAGAELFEMPEEFVALDAFELDALLDDVPVDALEDDLAELPELPALPEIAACSAADSAALVRLRAV